MARYKDADDLKAVIQANDWSNPVVPDVVCLIIDRSPDADVAPKSEVERLQEQVSDLQDELNSEIETNKHLSDEYIALMKENEKLTINMNAYGLAAKRLAEEKSEIFAEIESVLCRSVYPRINANGTITPISSKDLRIRCDDYNAIKKKYTEGESNG